MLTENHIREGLSRAYISAVAHRAGYNCSFSREFDYGVDGSLHEIKMRDNRRVENGFTIDFQAKASKLVTINSTSVVYDLEAKSFNDLTDPDRNPAVPFILILLAMPDKDAEWITHTRSELTLRRCAYWMSLRGVAPTTNTERRRIEIPIGNVFDVPGVRDLMGRVKRSEVL